jgi:hypothetical protein
VEMHCAAHCRHTSARGFMRYRVQILAAVTCGVLAASLPPSSMHAQEPDPIRPPADTAGAFLDPGAALLLERARAARLRTDHSVRSYTALVSSRGAVGLRMPLKDRSLLRYEAAARIRWSRDGDDLVHVLAGRVQTPGGVEPAVEITGLRPMDPGADRLYFGMMFGDAGDDDDFWIEHPLGDDGERHYRYRSGETMAIRLQDGREVRVVELRVLPRRMDPHTVRGVLWIETTSGALVQGAFRLARKVDILDDLKAMDAGDRKVVERVPLITPMEFDISLMTVEYSLWDMEHWLPRGMRLEGMARAGALRFPGTFDVGYRVLDVTTDADPELEPEADIVARLTREWRAGEETRAAARTVNKRRQIRITPTDQSRLLDSDLLPPPVWADAPEFLGGAELKAIQDRLESIPIPAHPGLPVRFGWGPNEPGMLRYNRVEGPSVGARLTAPLPYVTVTATARLGAADLQPNAELAVSRETTRRTLQLRGYHELTTVDPSGRALGAGNSLSALLLGRDEGEYYRATGAAVALAPPPLHRRSWELRGYAERQDAATRNTHVALPRLWADSVFRPNIAADAATQLGALLHVRPWWGTDPMRAQVGLDVLLQAEAGDFDLARGAITLRAAAPLGPGLRVGAEAGAGAATGGVPVQRRFFLGGTGTLRGYEPATLAGPAMARARLELARSTPYANLGIFSDWAWAGDRVGEIRLDHGRRAAGAGASVIDGLIRLDVTRALDAPRGWRVDLYLDALM